MTVSDGTATDSEEITVTVNKVVYPAPAFSLIGNVTDSTNFNDASILGHSGNYMYAGSWDDDTLSVWDISIPASPTFVISITNATAFDTLVSMVTSGNNAYVTSQGYFTILDITNPASPVMTSTILIGDNNTHWDHLGDIVIDDVTNHAYVPATYDDGLIVVDISDKNNPTIHARISNDASLAHAQGAAKSGDYLYVTLRNTGNAFTVVDVSNPANPTVVTSITDGNDPYTSDTFNLSYIMLDDSTDVAYVSTFNIANNDAKRMVTSIDISTPSSPVILNSTRDATLRGGFIFAEIVGNGQYLIGSTNIGPIPVTWTNEAGVTIDGNSITSVASKGWG